MDDEITFSGGATDSEGGTLPASALVWNLIMHHCDSDGSCHTHPVQDFEGVSNGSFIAPDHQYPSYLELKLTANSGGLTDTETVRLDPRTLTLTFQTNPGGLSIAFNGTQSSAPFTRTVIVGSTNTISAVTPQTRGKKTYNSVSWSDGGTQTHTIAPETPTTYSARFR